MRQRRAFAALLLLPGLLASSSRGDELRNAESAVTRALAKARGSVVTVFTPDPNDYDLTGVVVSSGGAILTLRRPFVGPDGKLAAAVSVRFPGKGDTEEATVIEDDERTDTILLRARGARGKALKWGRAADLQVGRWILLIGNTFGAGRESNAVASLGVISGISRIGESITAFHASTLVNPGSFGAPVLDLSGALLGITAPTVTAAGQQSVVMPFERIHDLYREKGGAAAREMAGELATHRFGGEIADAFGVVLADVAKEGARVLVGVRSDPLPGDIPPVEETKTAEKTEKKPEGGEPKPPPGPTAPEPVSGALPAFDRCSGVILAADGIIACPLRITGWPGPPRPLHIDLLDGRSLPAKTLGWDERLRVALVSVEASGLPVLADVAEVDQRAGRFTVALGFPHEDPVQNTPEVTAGIVSRTGALFGLDPGFHAIQTDAGVGGGNRGGPLLDMEGRLLGMLLDLNDTDPMGYGLRTRGSSAPNAGLGFAIPVQVLRRILPRLRQGEILKAPFLGLSVDDGPDGVVVKSVSEQNSKGEATAAKLAGLAPDDVLVSVGGRAVRRAADLRGIVADFSVGDEIEIVYTRTGSTGMAKAKLTER